MRVVEFRARDYAAEDKAHSLPRLPTHVHPLSFSLSPPLQGDTMDEGEDDGLDPLRAPQESKSVSLDDLKDSANATLTCISVSNSAELLLKEWSTFKRLLVQKFPASNMVSISSIADLMIGSHKAYENSSSIHLDEVDDPQSSVDEDVKYITQQEYTAKLKGMKIEIAHAWHVGDHFKSLKLSVKVARLLRDTASLQFYPTLFSWATDILDMLGEMVWERIKQKAECSEAGVQMRTLPEDFQRSDVSSEAKETCHNWFCKIGSIQELLPRIYLELAILPCWRFLTDDFADVGHRLVKMMRGLGDPLASAYCHLYFTYCLQKLPPFDKGNLVTCIKDISLMMVPLISLNQTTDRLSCMSKQIIVQLMEPPVEYIMKCIFKEPHQQATSVLAELGLGRNRTMLFGKSSCLSLVLHHMLKELPPEVVRTSAVDILELIQCSNDSSFDQSKNFRLLGFRLYEEDSTVDVVNVVVERLIQVLSQYQDLDAFLKIVDGYIDIVLQNQMNSQLELIIEGIAKRACKEWICDDELENLQSVLVKILNEKRSLEDVLELNHFTEVIELLHGSSRNAIYIHILDRATRNGYICRPAVVQFLCDVCQCLSNTLEDSIMIDGDSQPLRLISRFVQMVDFGLELERHLTFLIECRATFAYADDLKAALVHRGNSLAMNAVKDPKFQRSFARACLGFCEATIPSILSPVKQLYLFLETAEVALVCGSGGHTDGLIDSALSSLRNTVADDVPQVQVDADRILCMIQKLCSLLIMIPGDPKQGVIYIPKSLLSLVHTRSHCITVTLRVRALCAVMSSLAALSQKKLPYHASAAEMVFGNDLLYFDDPSYHEELVSSCDYILQTVGPAIKQEASSIARGRLALEACNCMAISLKMDDNTHRVCNELIELARSCTSINQDYLLSTSKFISERLQTVHVQQCQQPLD